MKAKLPDVPEKLYSAVGKAIVAWSYVENSTCSIFTKLAELSWWDGYNLFFSTESFSGKLKMVDTISKTSLTESDFKKWRTLKNKADKLSAKRNDLAHSHPIVSVYGDVEEGGEIKEIRHLETTLSKPEKFKDASRSYIASDILEIVDEFLKLSNELDQFHAKVERE